MSCERRIKNEMKNWPSDWLYGKDNNCIFITLLNFMPKKIFFLKIVLGDSYPFKQPTVICNDNDIIKFYRDTHSNPIKELQDDMKLLTGKECGCCAEIIGDQVSKSKILLTNFVKCGYIGKEQSNDFIVKKLLKNI